MAVPSSTIVTPTILPVVLAHGGPMTPEEKAFKAFRNGQNAAYPVNFWWFIIAFIAFLTVVYACARAIRTVRKYRILLRQVNAPMSTTRRMPNPHGPVAARRLPLAAVNAYRIAAYRWTLPLSNATLADAAVTILYTFLMLLWSYVNSRNATLKLWASRTGAIATSQMPLLPVLAAKNNILTVLTGIPHEKMIFLHRAAGRCIFLLLWLHGAGYYYNGTRFTSPSMLLGAVGLSALTLTTILSIKPVRAMMYEFFLVSHIFLVAIFMVAGYYHAEKIHETGYWVWAGMILWALDRVFRLARTVWTTRPWSSKGSSEATVELLSDDTIAVRMARPMSWSPGQHAFLTLPGVSASPLEAHPFTIATIPNPPGREADGAKELSFIIRARGGFTGRLLRQAYYAQATGQHTVKAYVDGPYGAPPDLTTYSTAILFAGGSGVSYTIAMLEDLVQQARKGTSAVKRVAFIWTVRDESHIAWISSQLHAALACVTDGLSVTVRIFVTRAPARAARPTPPLEPNWHPYEPTALRRTDTQTTLAGDGFSMKEKADLFSRGDVHVEYGRPNIHSLLVEEVSTSVDSVSVDVCGPAALTADVRRATRASDVAGPAGIARGMPSIALHVEEFSM
ncbi:hypothetical protein AURDEDRAFT_162494 [Auricularia subglabra TFB-10046 SS5]|nr:hypothetical protein AURDEDRAFT_162494 [Auricularia subglabra TFB-10046 SS5]